MSDAPAEAPAAAPKKKVVKKASTANAGAPVEVNLSKEEQQVQMLREMTETRIAALKKAPWIDDLKVQLDQPELKLKKLRWDGNTEELFVQFGKPEVKSAGMPSMGSMFGGMFGGAKAAAAPAAAAPVAEKKPAAKKAAAKKEKKEGEEGEDKEKAPEDASPTSSPGASPKSSPGGKSKKEKVMEMRAKAADKMKIGKAAAGRMANRGKAFGRRLSMQFQTNRPRKGCWGRCKSWCWNKGKCRLCFFSSPCKPAEGVGPEGKCCGPLYPCDRAGGHGPMVIPCDWHCTLREELRPYVPVDPQDCFCCFMWWTRRTLVPDELFDKDTTKLCCSWRVRDAWWACWLLAAITVAGGFILAGILDAGCAEGSRDCKCTNDVCQKTADYAKKNGMSFWTLLAILNCVFFVFVSICITAWGALENSIGGIFGLTPAGGKCETVVFGACTACSPYTPCGLLAAKKEKIENMKIQESAKFGDGEEGKVAKIKADFEEKMAAWSKLNETHLAAQKHKGSWIGYWREDHAKTGAAVTAETKEALGPAQQVDGKLYCCCNCLFPKLPAMPVLALPSVEGEVKVAVKAPGCCEPGGCFEATCVPLALNCCMYLNENLCVQPFRCLIVSGTRGYCGCVNPCWKPKTADANPPSAKYEEAKDMPDGVERTAEEKEDLEAAKNVAAPVAAAVVEAAPAKVEEAAPAAEEKPAEEEEAKEEE